MKDRFPMDEWPSEWLGVVVRDFPKMSRETKLFLAKAVRLAYLAKQMAEKRV